MSSIAADNAYNQLGGTKLRLVHPTSIVDQFNYQGATGAIDVGLAHFGRYQTGTSIQAPLFMPPVGATACGNVVPPEGHISRQFNLDWRGFVIVKEGECTYEEKARNVEYMGAQALIIAQDPLGDFIENRAWHDSESMYEGSGTSISIPTLIVNVEDGEKLIALIEGKANFDENVILKADIEISFERRQAVSYSLYYGSILNLQPELVLKLYEYQHALKDNAIFIPRILTFECPGCPQEIKDAHCVGNGQFCFTPPEDAVTAKYPEVTDHQLIMENLRELCIYDIIGDMEDEMDDHVFFKYLYEMHFTCLSGRMELTEECATEIMDQLQIPTDQVTACMSQSWDDEDDWESFNQLFYNDRMHAADLGIQLNPSVSINGHPYSGELKGEDIFAAICQAYHFDHIPDVCLPDFDLEMSLGSAEQLGVRPLPQTQTSDVEHHFVVLIVIGVVLFNLALICWCMRSKKREHSDQLQSQVQMQVEKYFKLESSEPTFAQ